MQESLDPQRHSAEELYRGTSGRTYHDEKRGLRPELLPWVMRLRALKFQRFVKRTDTVFEFGVGAGWNLGNLCCARKLGYDPADFLFERLKSIGIEPMSRMSEVGTGAADVALCHHVLEHVERPLDALRDLRRVIRPKGTLLVHVPWEKQSSFARYRKMEPNHHLYTWSPQCFGNLLGIAGLDVETIGVRRYGYDRFAAVLSNKIKAGYRGYVLLKTVLIALRPLHEVAAVCSRS